MDIQQYGNFTVIQPWEGVHHIRDAMDVCMTLLVGKERALLIDTGYGLDDVSAVVRQITDLPLTVLLTHGHHDHILGAYWFPKTVMFPEDLPDFRIYSSQEIKKSVMMQAEAKGLCVPENYLKRKIDEPETLEAGTMELGGMTAEVIRCPGHTPGSAVIYLPAYRLLLTGDDWNPCTWLFFSSALDIHSYLKNMSELLARLVPAWVLCPHRHKLYPVSMMQDFLEALTDERLQTAYPVKLSNDPAICPVRCVLPDDQ